MASAFLQAKANQQKAQRVQKYGSEAAAARTSAIENGKNNQATFDAKYQEMKDTYKKRMAAPTFTERVGKTASGWAQRTAAGHAGTLEDLTEGLGKLGSLLQNKKEQRLAAQEREYLAKYEQELAEAMASGDARAIKTAQTKVNQSKYRLKTMGDLGDYYDEVNREAVADIDAFGDKMSAGAERDFTRAKEGAGAVGRVAVDAATLLADVGADAAANMVVPGLGTAARVSRMYGQGSERAEDKGFGLGTQALYGGVSAALGEGTNRILNSNPILQKAGGKGFLDGKILQGMDATRLGRTVKSAGGEAFEETAENGLDWLAQTLIFGREKADKPTVKDVGYDALLAALVGGTTGVIGPNPNRNAVRRSAETQIAQNEGKVTTAQETGTQDVSGQNKTAPQMGTESYRANYDPMEAAAIQKVSKKFKNIVAGVDTSISDFFTKWKNGRKSHQGEILEKLYIGKVTDAARTKLSDLLGYEVKSSDYIITADNVKHIMDHHGNDAKEIQRGNLPLSTISMDDLADVVAHPDRIKLGDSEDWEAGRQAVEFEKDIGNGTVVYVQFDNFKRGTIEPRTLYIRKGTPTSAVNPANASSTYTSKTTEPEVPSNKGTPSKLDTATEAAPNSTSETLEPVPSTNSVPGNGQNVNVENLDPFLKMMMDGVGAANAGFDPFSAVQNQYGTQESGENPVRSDDVPVSVDGETKVSHTIVTAKGAQVTPDEFVPLIENETMKGGFSFIPITNDQSVEAAKKYITSRGWPQARADWTADVRQGKAGDQITAIGALLYNNAVNSGDTRAALDILDDYQFAVRTSARGLQAARILKTLSPENRLYMIRRSIRRMVEDLKLGEDIQLPDNLVNAYMGAKTDAEVNNAVSDIQQYVADQLPSTLLDMWTALRYVNMLGNFKTQVRNVAGNVGMRAVSTAQNAVATFFETVTGGRFGKTRSVFVDGGLKNVAKQDFQAVREQALSGGKYTLDEANAFAQGVKDKQKVFRGVLAPLEGYRKATNWAMNNQYFGDEGFIKGAYARYLAGYLKANGVTAEQFSDPQWQKTNSDFVDKARSFAVQQAQEVTFRDSNTLSNWVSKIGRRSDTPAAVKMVSEGMMPFRRTPANVLLRAEEYSPMGIVNTALQVTHKGLSKTKLTEKDGLIGAYARSGAEISGTDIINSLSKTLTGTGIFLIGMALASAGMLRGGGTGDDEQDAFDELTGHQDYSLILEDGTSITLDWLTPASMPLFMGAELERLRQEGGIELKDLEASLTSILEPMIQMSMMQGVNDTLHDLKYAQDANIIQIAATAALGYLTQGLTNSLVGQISRSTKEESMMTYVDKDSAVPAWLQREIGAASRKFPGEGYNQIPYIDAWGRTEATGDPLERAAKNLFNPAYVSQVEVDKVERELQRLADATGEVGIFPKRAEKSISVGDGKEKNFTAEEYVAYARDLGQTSYKLVQAGMNTAAYRSMSNSAKVEYLNDLYSYASAVARAKAGGKALEGWQLNARNAQKDLGVSTAEYIALYQKYGSSMLSGNGYDTTKRMVDAGLTFDQWADMKDTVDKDNNGNVSKAETTEYIEANFQKEFWNQVFTAYKGNRNWKNPYA